MSRRPLVPFDLAALTLLLTGLFVALTVFGHDPTHPFHEESPHLLGPVGAWLGSRLQETLGVAVYVFLATWFVLVVGLFLRRGVLRWLLRLMGWSVLIPTVAILADALESGWGGGPLTGSGGSFGAFLAVWLQDHLTPLGRTMLAIGLLVFGLACAADVVVLWLMRMGWKTLRWMLTRRSPKTARQQSQPEPVEPPKEEVAEPSAPIPETTQVPEMAAETSADVLSVPINRPQVSVPPPTVESESERFADFELPRLDLLDDPPPFPYDEQDQLLRERAALLEKTFTDFGLNVKVVGINTGPVITQYEISLETGLRVNKVTRLADDLALNMRVPSVRVVAPIPGKNTVGIEVPNERRALVGLKEVILASGKKAGRMKIPLFLGKDSEGQPLVNDLAEMPHLLIAGRTGTGKSVCMNSIILSILMTRRPDEVKMIMIDPKMLEMSEYARVPHLMSPVVKDMRKAEAILAWAVDKMEERYELLSRARVRSIASYNELSHAEILRRVQPEEGELERVPERMPYIVIFIDEMADLIMMMRKEVEGHVIRLAQKSRAAGIHLVVATQKPTVDVITGLIKSNLPARICFKVVNKSDSRVVLDEMGADKLLGKGDMLFLPPGTSSLVRAQGTYLADAEIARIVEFLECDPCYAQELVQLPTSSERSGPEGLKESLRERDDLYETAVEIVIREGRGSVSLLQRAMGIGYGRAARLIDFMAEDGIVGSYNGSSAREVLYSPEQWEAMKAAR